MKTNKSYSAVASAIRTHAKDIASRFGIKSSQVKKCVEKLVEAFGPLDVDDAATLGDAFYRFPLSLVNDAFESLDPAAAFHLIEQSDLRQLAYRIQTAEYLLQETTPLCTRADLLEYASQLREFLLEHRDYLIGTGLPPEPFRPSRWLYLQLGRLYDTRTTSAPWPAGELFGHTRDADQSQRPPYRWVRYEAGTTPWLPIRGPEQVLECPYEQASYLKGLEEGDAERIERDRSRLWRAKEQVLAALAKGMAVRDVEQPWKDCLAALTGNLTADDLEFYLRMDRYYLGVDFTEADESSAHPVMIPGGLTNLLEVIGHYEQEKRIGMLHTTREKIPPELLAEWANPPTGARDARWVYLKLYDHHLMLNAAIDHLSSLREPAKVCWRGFRDRIRGAFKDEFRVIVHIPVSPQWSGPLERLFNAQGRWVEEHDAQDISMLVSRQQRGPAFFHREGDSWVISFDGKFTARPASDGLYYLARLLADPNVEQTAGSLRRDLALIRAPSERREIDTGDEFGVAASDCGPTLDAQYKADVRRRKSELRLNISKAEQNGNKGEAEKLKQELHTIEALEAKDIRRGKSRRISSKDKNDRDSVRNAINRALQDLRERHEPLWYHLRESYRMIGCRCRYTPREPVFWNVFIR